MDVIDQEAPFFPNTDDGTRCYQAVIKMVVKRYRPERECSWDMLDRVTNKIVGAGTWPLAGTVWLHEQGLDVSYVEPMDNRRFAKEGARYFEEFYGPATTAVPDAGTDYAREQANAQRLVECVPCEVRVPNLADIRRLVAEQYLLICLVNSRSLNGQTGYKGHFVLVKGCDRDALVLHDPGPPGIANRRVTFETFERAWAYPDERSKNFTAVRDRIESFR